MSITTRTCHHPATALGNISPQTHATDAIFNDSHLNPVPALHWSKLSLLSLTNSLLKCSSLSSFVLTSSNSLDKMLSLFVLWLIVSTGVPFAAAQENPTADNSSLCGGSCTPNTPPPNYIQYKEAPPPPPPAVVQANCPPAVVVQCCQYPPPSPYPYTQLPYNNYSASGRPSSIDSILFGGFVLSFFASVV